MPRIVLMLVAAALPGSALAQPWQPPNSKPAVGAGAVPAINSDSLQRPTDPGKSALLDGLALSRPPKQATRAASFAADESMLHSRSIGARRNRSTTKRLNAPLSRKGSSNAAAAGFGDPWANLEGRLKALEKPQ